MTTARVGPRSRCADGEAGHHLHRCVVVQRLCNHSAFNGYRWTPSDYSSIRCLDCGAFWRTKAEYVAVLPDASRAEAIA